MNLEPGSYIALVIYLPALLVVGWLLRRRSRSREGAYLADRRLGTGLMGASLAATAIGGSATVVLARHVHSHGLAGIWLDLPLCLGLVLFAFLLAGRVRATGCFSLPHLAGRLYGRRLRLATGWLVLLASITWFALLVRAGAPFLAPLTPLSERGAVILLALSFVLYTAIGGQAAVAWTDAVQLVLLLGLGLLLPAGLVLINTAGLAGLSPGALSFPLGGELDIVDVIGLIALFGLPALVGGDVYSKTLSARDSRTARRGVFLAAALKFLAAASVTVLALGAHILLPDLSTGNDLLPSMLGALLPEWLAPLVLIAFLAAFTSTADSVLITGATVIDIDLSGPKRLSPTPWRPNAAVVIEDRGAKRAQPSPRVFIVLMGAVGTVVALAHDDIVTLMRWSYTIFVAGAPVPILMGFTGRFRISDTAACVALLAGGGVAVVLKFVGLSRPAPVLPGLLVATSILLASHFFSRP